MTTGSSDIDSFWSRACEAVAELRSLATVPDAFAFGATAEQADCLLALVVDGVKTATSSSFVEYEYDGVPLPRQGDISIVTSSFGEPRAVILTTTVQVVPFQNVSAQHAVREGEGDKSLANWRAVHEEFWRSSSRSGFAIDMPVVCEEFRVVYSDFGEPR